MRKKLRQFDNPKWLQTDVRPHFIKALKLVHTLVNILFKADKPTIRQIRLAPLFLLAALFPALLLAWLHWSGFAQPLSTLGEIKERGKLVVATRYGPTTYFNGPDGPAGFEYDLISDFAESLGVEAEFVIPENLENTLTLVNKEEANLVATGIPYSPDDANKYNLGPGYLEVSRLIVSFEKKKKIKELNKITKGVLNVTSDTSHEAHLDQLKKSGELKLPWKTSDELDSERLLYLVNEEVIDYTIVDSNEYAYFKRYFQNLKKVYELSKPQPIAWAMKKSRDQSLLKAVDKYFNRIKKNGQLEMLVQRYYQHIDKLKKLDTDTFWKRVETRLPEFDKMFKDTAEEYELDWRLLAAVGYQESHWNPKAVSPTGVKGLMMLTNATAKQVKIRDRTNPAQSITGAARYILWLMEQLPESLNEEDKVWFTLAAYNVGLGHLLDARVLTQRDKANPDRWLDVRERLPLLGRAKWYKTVKYGYARGREPVTYVDNIRNFYDLLVWKSNSTAGEEVEAQEQKGEAPAEAVAEEKPAAKAKPKAQEKPVPKTKDKPKEKPAVKAKTEEKPAPKAETQEKTEPKAEEKTEPEVEKPEEKTDKKPEQVSKIQLPAILVPELQF
ncbi:membrane-bound lytic murein transglycosylase MltF [Solemya velum gill symbiont]|uniref:membrane-bound lytic murein transglycosylase MltF n=1 Tax=Solemya velum gill symbiont TaxID=2340 RepID=UPI000998306F|nr:membrane-bound lytic murein transglycosylase MltF [Solemya velum gill symbiont]OOY51851.1 hypothetical protein BOV97_07110 [Solemya velum gill symbiont]OOY55963.1 hypothetical protein BOV99_06115 [Solemya velum gill symbiont]OOY57286.1 hypothetical protein BOW00_05915 [Solemya velum gill symbiont]OOY60146.1 hypothetical protein BOW02_06465 [Solemya velum gill symbiont]OOY61657.1 hypothetical protein BOW04_08295 [Solemya velum gill symbiont]